MAGDGILSTAFAVINSDSVSIKEVIIMLVDFHMHSTASDGVMRPLDLRAAN